MLLKQNTTDQVKIFTVMESRNSKTKGLHLLRAFFLHHNVVKASDQTHSLKPSVSGINLLMRMESSCPIHVSEMPLTTLGIKFLIHGF
jgi:hypothetical protein